MHASRRFSQRLAPPHRPGICARHIPMARKNRIAPRSPRGGLSWANCSAVTRSPIWSYARRSHESSRRPRTLRTVRGPCHPRSAQRAVSRGTHRRSVVEDLRTRNYVCGTTRSVPGACHGPVGLPSVREGVSCWEYPMLDRCAYRDHVSSEESDNLRSSRILTKSRVSQATASNGTSVLRMGLLVVAFADFGRDRMRVSRRAVRE